MGCEAGKSSPSKLLLELGAQEQVSEKKDVAQFPSPLYQLHHETVLQELPVLSETGDTVLVRTGGVSL